jgi:hypothetical protein
LIRPKKLDIVTAPTLWREQAGLKFVYARSLMAIDQEMIAWEYWGENELLYIFSTNSLCRNCTLQKYSEALSNILQTYNE